MTEAPFVSISQALTARFHQRRWNSFWCGAAGGLRAGFHTGARETNHSSRGDQILEATKAPAATTAPAGGIPYGPVEAEIFYPRSDPRHWVTYKPVESPPKIR